MPAKRPTLRDVARAAGVSHMTVQRAIHSSPLVAPLTAERVRQQAARLGYRPDPTLSALSAYRWKQGARPSGNVLAFLDCDRTLHSKKVLEGARQEARLLGYQVDDFILPSASAAQVRLGRTLYHRGIRGLLFGPTDQPCKFEGWDWTHFAPVSLDALTHQPALDAVAMDYFHGATLAMEHLRATGCRRIGLAIETGLQARSGNRWLGGCLAAGLWIAVFSGNIASAIALRKWCREKRIDGVLTIHHEVHRALHSPKVRIAFLNTFNCPPGVPRLVLDPARIGGEGVRMLHHALLRGELGLPTEPKTISLRGTWATS